jgi:hypothetical protein
VVLYELLTGERPAGTDLPSDVNPNSPKWLDDVFKRSYARIDKRFLSAADFQKALSYVDPPPIPRSQPRTAATITIPPSAVQSNRTHCPHCRQPVAGDDNFCMHCGVQMVSHVRRCAKCGAYPDPRDRYCILCGEELSSPAILL